MAGEASNTATERRLWLEAEFAGLTAEYEATKAEMTPEQRIARATALARLSTAISQATAAGQRARKTAYEADRALLKVEADLRKARASKPAPTRVEGDETEMDAEPDSGRDQRTAEELRREIKGRLDLVAARVLARPVPGVSRRRRTADLRSDVGLQGGAEAVSA